MTFDVLGTDHLGSGVPAVLAAANDITARTQRIDQLQAAIDEIRNHVTTVDAQPFVTDAHRNMNLAGEKQCAAVIAAILERHGLA
ncbi:hypothetical protein C1Y40_04138 [Mycobacterium talmoniae]|uniref:Uncharacterized protein n=1 Tax=Mycobacterium talmoniae TaxID=1858794 RepID=A0A2S8BG95_9MYCO|nr:hypothetical protein C1Y40_04138 [Mycobacterium talmoniae]